MMAKILIVDDDTMLCEMVKHKLSPAPEIFQAHTIADGLKVAAMHPCDLILLDVRLPDGSDMVK